MATDIYIIYKKVKQRVHRARHDRMREAAEAALAVCRNVLESPTLPAVARFRALEIQWLAYATSRAACLADELERAIASGDFVVNRPFMKNFSAGHDPSRGTIYCMTCADAPGLIRVGHTQDSILKRRQKFAARYNLTDLRIPLWKGVKRPALVEYSIHEALRDRRVIGPNGTSDWFAATVPQVARVALRVIRKLKLGL